MSNSRQCLVPSNYDATKEIYPRNEIVRKRHYLIDEVITTKDYLRKCDNVKSTETNTEPTTYADKLRQRIKY